MFTQVTHPKERRLLGEMLLSSSAPFPPLLPPLLPEAPLEAKPPRAREVGEEYRSDVRDPARDGYPARQREDV